MNFKEEYDLIVVGAGPGGSIAAREAAKKGLSVLVIERRQEVGSPVRCGEGLGEVWMKKAGLEYDSTWCLQEMNGAVLYAPNGRVVKIPTGNKGYVIERKMFEKKLAAQAIREGAQYLVKTQVIDVIKDEKGFVTGVKTKGGLLGEKSFKAKLVIAADGVDSQTAKYAGINTFNPLSEVDSGYEYEMSGVKMEDSHMIHLYVGNDIAPRGYVWVFPKGEDVANVGIGIAGDNQQTAKYYLDKFIASHPEIFEKAGAYEEKGGCVPVSAPLEKPYADGLMIIGDAAHMVNPIHGGGMGTAMEAAVIAAKVAAEAISKGDVSEQALKPFADEWFEERGNQLKRVLKVRKFFEKLSDDDMNYLADVFINDTELLLRFSDGDKFSSAVKMFAKHPRLALFAAKMLV